MRCVCCLRKEKKLLKRLRYTKRMKHALIIGGPIILTLGGLIWADIISFGEESKEDFTYTGDLTDTIYYNGKYLPLDQLAVNPEENCGSEHYHAKNHTGVTATDGSEVPDPGPDCGYGKVSAFDVVGLELELDSIEYRDGASTEYNKTKQPGLTKYANITLKWPGKLGDTIFWKFIVGDNDVMEHEAGVEEGGTFKMVDPPTLVIPGSPTSGGEQSVEDLEIDEEELTVDIEPATIRPQEF